ncbi:MAG: DUF4153 domain-containing protein, partial [Clostridia bacterium]|nr:DUF4153 domain-containing protein [Clostridia bacterium]
MKKFVRNAIDNLKVVVRRFPIVLAVCAAAGVFGLLISHEVFADQDIPVKILMCLFMFALSCLCAKVAYESYEKITKIIYAGLLIGGACLATCFGLFLLNLDYQYTGVRYAAVMFALVALFLAVPYLGKLRGSDEFANRLIWRGAITALFTGVLIGGLCALFFAIQELLNVNMIDEIYGDTAIVVAALFTPMLFLTGVKQFEAFKSHKLFKVLTVYILMPLLLAYTAVVYAYLIMIMFNNFEMPSGIVGNLVLWYGLVGIFVLFLAKAYLDKGFGKFFNRFYPIASIAPLVVMFIALALRINQYGVTENRYYSLIAGIWISAMIVYFIVTAFADKRRNVVVLASLVVVVALSVIGPWSAGSVSLRSQSNRLEQALEEEGALADGEITSLEPVSQHASDIVRYIDRNHGFDNVAFLSESKAGEIANIRTDKPGSEVHAINEEYGDTAIDISGFDFLVSLQFDEGEVDIDDNLYYTHDENGVVVFYMDERPVLTLDIGKHYSEKMGDTGVIGDKFEDFV